jgi:glycerophosphoryl diester phosphodiesterase
MRPSFALPMILLTACAAPPSTDDEAGETETTETETTADTESESSDSETSTDTESESSDTGDPPGNLLLSDEFLIIAHRGGAELRPEETLPAYENAIAIGAHVIEMDVHATSDGVVVLLHDDTVDRTTDGTGAVSGMTFAELQALDAGYEFTTDGGTTFPYRGMGIVVPSLDQVLTAFPDTYYLIEIKQSEPPIVDAVLSVLADHAVEDRVVIASFDDATIEAVRAANPNLLTAMSGMEMAEFVGMMDSPDYQPPCQFMQSPWDISSQAFIDRAHELGMKVHPWTVDESGLMMELIERGVDGIMTDDPELLVQVAG